MSNTVNNLTNSHVSTDMVLLAPYASGSVKVLTSDILALVSSGVLSISPSVAQRELATLVDSTGGTASTTMAAIVAGATYAQADLIAIKNAIASLTAQLAIAKLSLSGLHTNVIKLADLATE